MKDPDESSRVRYVCPPVLQNSDDAARLEETEDRMESVAEGSGFSNEEQMRCSFIRILGIPPREYRKRFATTV